MSLHRHVVVFFDSVLSRADGELRGGGRGWGMVGLLRYKIVARFSGYPGVFNINMGIKLNQKRSGSNGENTFQG